MNLPKNAWYMRIYYACAWLQARATFKRLGTPLKDPTDLCPFIRMYVFWGPLSLAVLLLYAAVSAISLFGIGMLLFKMGYGVIDWNGPAGDLLRRALLNIGAFVAVIAMFAGILWIGKYVVLAIVWLIIKVAEGIGSLSRAVAKSPVGIWVGGFFPKAAEPPEEEKPKPVATEPEKEPRPPSFVTVLLAWLDGKIHGFCVQITVVSKA